MQSFIKGFEELKKIDSSDMFQTLKDFPQQIRKACEIGRDAAPFTSDDSIKKLLIIGMGGSAIGGDLLRSYLAVTSGADHIAVSVSRGYSLPGTVDSDTNVIGSSYSGNTEETLAAFAAAVERTTKLACITTGGRLEELAANAKSPIIKIPGGMMPRCALGYSFFPMLYLVLKSGSVSNETADEIHASLKELLSVMIEKSSLYSQANEANPALQLAVRLRGKIPVIYSASERMDAVNLRWRCQIQENAKNAAFGNLLPEMNHNEINGWSYPLDLSNEFSVVILRDIDDHEKVKVRFDALEEILSDNGIKNSQHFGQGEHLLARMFDLIYFGDWVSYYMALLNQEDPTPIPLITKLKDILSRH